MTEKSLMPYDLQPAPRRSIEVTRTYLTRGSSVSRSLWVRIAPRNPLLKAVMAVPLISAAALLFLLIIIMLGFVLLALVIISLASRGKGRQSQ